MESIIKLIIGILVFILSMIILIIWPIKYKMIPASYGEDSMDKFIFGRKSNITSKNYPLLYKIILAGRIIALLLALILLGLFIYLLTK